MAKEITIGSQGGGMGDNLILTPLFKYFKNSNIEIVNTEYGKDISSLYDGLASISLKDFPILEKDFLNLYADKSKSNPFENSAVNMLRMFGIENKVSPIPKVMLNDQKTELAKKYLSKYRNPIALVTYGAGYKKIDMPDQKCPEYRLLDPNKWQNIIDILSEKYTVIHFSRGKTLIPLNNCVEINNLSIDELKHYFGVIKKYIGIDTGSYHLMLAVGGHSHVIVPKLSWENQYCPSNWQYPEPLWEIDGDCRVNYYDKDTGYMSVLDNL